jgi:hypothetical protein
MRGPRPVTEVPDVVGLGTEDACDIVRRAKLVPTGPDGDGMPTSGVVTAQRPVGAAGAEEGTQVVLWTHPGRDSPVGAVAPGPVESAPMDPV